MENFNIDKNTINKLKGMLNNGDLDNLVNQIPPEMMQNFSNLMSNNSGLNNTQQRENSSSNCNDKGSSNNNISNFKNNTNSNDNINESNNSTISNNINNFDFSKIDMNMILKMKSIMENLNSSNDPRSNLLYSLKPYLRDEKKNKIDQYANLLNFAKVAEVLKSDNKENKKNE